VGVWHRLSRWSIADGHCEGLLDLTSQPDLLEQLRQQRILVTSATVIGRYLGRRLIKLGATVYGLSRSALVATVPVGVEPIAADVTHRQAAMAALERVWPSHVLHLAAAGVTEPFLPIEQAVEVNVSDTVNVLEAARDAGVECVVHTSTSEVYGTAQHVPIDEAHPLQGQSPYSASKIGADKMAEAFHRSFSLPVVMMCPFNTLGPRQSARGRPDDYRAVAWRANRSTRQHKPNPRFEFCCELGGRLCACYINPSGNRTHDQLGVRTRNQHRRFGAIDCVIDEQADSHRRRRRARATGRE